MCGKQGNKMSEYQLRRAAGKYWLLYMEQKGIPYERPLQLNDVGAEMWNLLKDGTTTEQMIEYLAKNYDVEKAEIRADVTAFLHQLEEYGISIGV